jgi:UDP-N-acetyl-D-mannosaminuronic acid dehydrogenase
VEGNALYELRALPQIVGGFDEKSTNLTEALFKTFTDTVIRMNSLEEAEMVKLVNNTYRETMFSFANEISMISRTWGMDTKKVIESANAGYLRSNVPLPSPGVGGYCLTKDAYLLMESAEAKGVKPHLIHQARYVTAYILDSIGKEIETFIQAHHKGKKGIRIAILGFAFKGKPATSDTRGSTTPVLMKRLQSLLGKIQIVGHDPAVTEEKIREMGAEPVSSIMDAVRGSHIVIIMNNNPAFANLPHQHFSDSDGQVMFYDAWGLHAKDHFKDLPHITHSTL